MLCLCRLMPAALHKQHPLKSSTLCSTKLDSAVPTPSRHPSSSSRSSALCRTSEDKPCITNGVQPPCSGCSGKQRLTTRQMMPLISTTMTLKLAACGAHVQMSWSSLTDASPLLVVAPQGSWRTSLPCQGRKRGRVPSQARRDHSPASNLASCTAKLAFRRSSPFSQGDQRLPPSRGLLVGLQCQQTLLVWQAIRMQPVMQHSSQVNTLHLAAPLIPASHMQQLRHQHHCQLTSCCCSSRLYAVSSPRTVSMSLPLSTHLIPNLQMQQL